MSLPPIPLSVPLLVRESRGQSHATPPPGPPPQGRPRRKPARPRRTEPGGRVSPALDDYGQALVAWLAEGCEGSDWEALTARKGEAGAPPWLDGEALGLDALSHQVLGVVLAHMIQGTLTEECGPFGSGEEVSGRSILKHLRLPLPNGMWQLAQCLGTHGDLCSRGYLVSDTDILPGQSQTNLASLMRADFSLNLGTLGRLLGLSAPAPATPSLGLEDLVLPESVRQVLGRLLADAPPVDRPFRVMLDGPEHSGRRSLAKALADHFQVPFRMIRPMNGHQPGAFIGVEIGRGFDDDDWRRVANHPGWTFLIKDGDGPYYDPTAGCDLVLELRSCAPEDLQSLARRTLQKLPSLAPLVQVDALTDPALAPGSVVRAIRQLGATARWTDLTPETATARLQALLAPSGGSGQDLPREVITPHKGLEHLCLPPETRERFDQVIAAIQGRGRMLAEWQLDENLVGKAQGVALFHGPSGTGKSMGAEVLAHELGLPLWRMEASELESPFVGESESRLHAFFARSQNQKCVLLLDEADSVLTDRRLAEGSSRRYVTSLTNAWLRELDRFEGILVLTSNHAASMDPAVERRIMWRIPFELPGPEVRLRIWQSLFGQGAIPGRESLDLEAAARHPLTGGRIRNAFLSACQKGAAAGRMTQELLQAACAEEVQSGISGQATRRACGFGA